jgi:hypothetical protein
VTLPRWGAGDPVQGAALEGQVGSNPGPLQFPWQFFCGERRPVAYYRLVSQLEYTAEQLATEEALPGQGQ